MYKHRNILWFVKKKNVKNNNRNISDAIPVENIQECKFRLYAIRKTQTTLSYRKETNHLPFRLDGRCNLSMQ